MATRETIRRRDYHRKRRETHREELNDRSRQWYYAHRQQVLSKHSERMATDPEYAEKIRENARRSYALRSNPTLRRQKQQREERNRCIRERYRTDPEYRAKCLANSASTYEKKRKKDPQT